LVSLKTTEVVRSQYTQRLMDSERHSDMVGRVKELQEVNVTSEDVANYYYAMSYVTAPVNQSSFLPQSTDDAFLESIFNKEQQPTFQQHYTPLPQQARPQQAALTTSQTFLPLTQ
jgi:hypothetical protein